jgi:hypothetical protein
MSKMQTVRAFLFTAVVPLAGLPLGCGHPADAPTAPSASAVTDTGKSTPPQAVKKGRRIVNPGGAVTAEP